MYDFHEPTLFQCLSIMLSSTWEHIKVPWSNLVNRYNTTLYDLGPYCASLYLFLEIQHTLRCIQSESLIQDKMEIESVDLPCTLEINNEAPPDDITILWDIISDFKGFFWDPENPDVVPVVVPITWCTPKVKALRDILLEFYTESFQVIIFVEQRQVAACLSKVLPAIPELKDKIRSAHLVGQGVNVDGVSKATDTYFGDALEEFRTGKINVCEFLSHIPMQSRKDADEHSGLK
jgi:endoribonuclease Dicer